MWFELLAMVLTLGVAAHFYFDGLHARLLLMYRRELRVVGVIIAGFVAYWMLKFRPAKVRSLLSDHGDKILAHLPLDAESARAITPVIDFTKMYTSLGDPNAPLQRPVIRPGNVKPTKRSVSESVKKLVAASQSWRCGHCRETLSATYEIDHKVRLEYGGSNSRSNLEALCRNCHGQKTIHENAGW